MAASPDSVGDIPKPNLKLGLLRRFAKWAGRVQLERKLAITLLIGAVSSGIATFITMTDNLTVASKPQVVLLLLNLDLVLLLGLSALIARRLVILWVAHKRGLAGAHLHARLVGLFSLVAVTPTIIVAIFSVMLFDYGLQGWFSARVSTAIKESSAVAQAYLYEHQQTINADALAMAQDLDREGRSLSFNPQRFNKVLATQSVLRSLTEAVVFDSAGRVLARSGFGLLLDTDPQIPEWAIQRAREGEVVILTSESEDRVRALVALGDFRDAFLYVGRPIDPRVLGHIDRTQGASKLYQELEGQRSGILVTFALIFVVVAMLLLLAAVWVGLAFATHLTRPIGNLISAAEQVRAGDLAARVDARDSGEIGNLSRAFNRMTGELESQQKKLIEANQQLDQRSHFIEAVLGGVSAGVIGLDKDGVVTLPNRSACNLLSMTPAKLKGKRLADIVPEMGELLKETGRRPKRINERNMTLLRSDGTPCMLLVRIAAELDEGSIIGFVATFDDVTELLSAQRKAAWADVARRIAHEIKNPLTPIQLSAERLKRKYLGDIENDQETFLVCTDTIIRQVGDIGRMVDEFSSFARMPAPVMVNHDLAELIDQAVFLQQNAYPEITFTKEIPDHGVTVPCDSQQIGQALTNLLLNGIDAIDGREASSDEAPPKGHIIVRLIDDGDHCAIEIEDNGCGLPKAERHRLTEPYVTTRESGTGLGLAIVKKIMEDHGGNLKLMDGAASGAKIRLLFQLPQEQIGSLPIEKTVA